MSEGEAAGTEIALKELFDPQGKDGNFSPVTSRSPLVVPKADNPRSVATGPVDALVGKNYDSAYELL